ncbi:4Fe-4S dicluster domain-containing protein [bacterium]|nr:4Fe-4S dicluster domain-containing protein [FCB group bacterium]MBL7191623.1 4Fe-4S dicluster domain-containing protein [bacterium]
MAKKFFVVPVKKREEELRAAFWEQIKSIPRGDKIQNCIQCGTCTGTCPVSYMMDITPREIVALFRAGHLEDILHSRAIWICASCYSCRVRCPSGILVTDLMYALKRLAMNKKIYPPKFPVHALSKAFIFNIYKYGRNFEIGLAIRYFLKADPKKLLASTGFGFAMIKKGRISLLPKSIKKVKEIRAIIDKAKQLEKEGA